MAYFVKGRTGFQPRVLNPGNNVKPVTGFQTREFKNPVRENSPGLNLATDYSSGVSGNSEVHLPGTSEGSKGALGIPALIPQKAFEGSEISLGDNPGSSSGLSGAQKVQKPDYPGYSGKLKKSEVDHG